MIDKETLRYRLDVIREAASKHESYPKKPEAMSGIFCRYCGNELTNEEAHYFSDTCNGCETVWHERIKAWRKGAHDPALDAGRFYEMPEVH